MFAGKTILKGRLKFAAVAFPLAWSFTVLAVGAKNVMSSASGFVLIESAFTLVQYAVASPLIATVYARRA